MAVQNLVQRDGRFLGWSHRETDIAASTTTDPVVIPPLLAGQNITTVVIGGTNTVKCEYTISPDSMVVAGTAVWHEVAATAVGTTVGKITWPVTALRAVTGSTTTAKSIFEILV